MLTFTGIARADDSYVSGVSGTIVQMDPPNPQVSMVSEVVRIDHLPEGRVDARFVFKNLGGPTNVLVGFPAICRGERVYEGLKNFRSC